VLNAFDILMNITKEKNQSGGCACFHPTEKNSSKF
jgi:hypothetical protein